MLKHALAAIHKTRPLIAGVALAAALGCASAQADTKSIGTYGGWDVFAGTSDKNEPICGMSAYHAGPPFRFIALKYQGSQVFIHITKDTWSLPTGRDIRVVLQVDNVPGRRFVGRAVRSTLLELQLAGLTDPETGESSERLMANLIRNGRTLRISFPDGNESYWEATLDGSAAALNRFIECGRVINARLGKPTQPYAETPATQPHAETAPKTPAVPTTRPSNPYSEL